MYASQTTMARRTPQPRLPPSERRALIEAAAGRLFARQGYEATTLDEIARAAYVTKPMVYRHFSSKKALYLALLARHREQMPRFARLTNQRSAIANVRTMVDAWLEYVQAHSDVWRMIFRDTSGDAEVCAARRELHTRAHAVIASFVAAQPGVELSPEALEPAAELLRSGMAGLALWFIDHPRAPRDQLVRLLTRVVLAAAGHRRR